MLHLSQPLPCATASCCSRRCPLSLPSSSSSSSTPLHFATPKPPLFSRAKKLSLSLPSTPPLAAPPNADAGSSDRPSAPDEIVAVGDEGIPLEGVIQFDRPNSPSPLPSWGRVGLLSGGDVLMLLVFAAIGRYNHGFPVFNVETLHTVDPFIAGWFLSAYFLGGYADDGKGVNGLTKAIFAAAKSWAVGIPLGLVIRAATLGHILPTSFVLVTMGSTGVLLIGWRALISALLPYEKKKNDVYRRGSPFELFELLTSLIRRW